MIIKFGFLLLVLFLIETSATRTKRAAVTYKDGHVIITSDRGKDIELAPGQGGQVKLNSPIFKIGSGQNQRCRKSNEGTVRYSQAAKVMEVCNGVRFVAVGAKLGSRRNPAKSCAAIVEDDWSAPSGAYYLETNPSVTKVYCHMESIPGCGAGGWTTIMKTNGHKQTFGYKSALWTNKVAYQVSAGQAGNDHQETKMPTYWTLSFTRLCLGLSVGGKHRWLRLNYRAKSLYSVIADGRYRAFSIGRNRWKSLIAGSSLQKNCNREGFNNFAMKRAASVRIGIIGNNENDCKTPDSRLGFGTGGSWCSLNEKSTTGSALCSNNIDAFGVILAQ